MVTRDLDNEISFAMSVQMMFAAARYPVKVAIG